METNRQDILELMDVISDQLFEMNGNPDASIARIDTGMERIVKLQARYSDLVSESDLNSILDPLRVLRLSYVVHNFSGK